MNQQERNKLDALTVKVGVIESRQIQHAETQKEIQESQLETHDKVDRLLHYVVGDKDTETKGVVQKQLEQEDRLTRLERIYLAVGLIVGLILSTQNLWLPIFR